MKVVAEHQLAVNRTPFPWRELAFGAGATLAIHCGLLVWFAVGRNAEPEPKAEPVLAMIVESELLRWGEQEPDPTAMPQIANPRPAPDNAPPSVTPPTEETREAPTETVDLRANERAESATPTERRAQEVEANPNASVATNRGPSNPNRPTNDVPIEGFADGFRGGTSLSPSAQRNLLARIQEQLQSAFRPPRSLSDTELQRLKIRVHVRISKEGQILGWEVLESSGNRQFDSAALTTLNRFRNGMDRLDMASIRDVSYREFIESQGLPITMVGQ